MSSSSPNINDFLPVEMVQKILRLTLTTSLSNILQIRSTCRLWNELIFNEYYLNKYFLTNQRQSLLYHLKLEEDDDLKAILSKSDITLTIGESPIDNDQLKCVTVDSTETKIKDKIDTTQSEEYTVGFWLNSISKPSSEYADDCLCLFGVKRDVNIPGNFIYTPGVGLSYRKDLKNNSGLYMCDRDSLSSYFNPVFELQQNQWYYICLIQKKDDEGYLHQIRVNGRRLDERRSYCSNPKNVNTELIFGLSHSKWKLLVADVNVWNHALTKLEVEAISRQRVSAGHVRVGQYLFEVYLKEKLSLASVSPLSSPERSCLIQTESSSGRGKLQEN